MRLFVPFAITAAVLLLNVFHCTALAVGGGLHQAPSTVCVITHAAGRMGKLLALQVKEDAELEGREIPQIRAVVRSDEEAMSVKCDLGGMAIVGGKAAPIPLDWLDVVVVKNIEADSELSKLRSAFQGAHLAILCDASHNELVWKDDDTCSISVPASENKDLSERLLAEIDAATRSSTLRHTLLRSSMGLAAGPNSPAGKAMGGEIALDGPQKAEDALKASPLEHTILRLGVLTDDPGMVPLLFGVGDSILYKRIDSGNSRPPIISRADAARVSTFLLKEPKAFKKMVIDCSWHPKFGRSSVGTEEAVKMASRQDLKNEILSRCDGVSIPN